MLKLAFMKLKKLGSKTKTKEVVAHFSIHLDSLLS